MANERRIIELVLKAVGEPELKRITAEMVQLKTAAVASQRQLESMGASMEKFGSIIKGAIGAGLIGTALHELGAAAAGAASQMDELSVQVEKVGVAAADLQKLQFGARLSNVDVDALNKGLIKLSVNMADVAGKNSAATKALRDLGITAKTSTLDDDEKARRSIRLDVPNGAQKTALAVQEFGKAGAELIPLLDTGSKGIAEMAKEAEDLGGVMSGEALAGANALHDQLDRLQTISEGLVKHFVGGLAPSPYLNRRPADRRREKHKGPRRPVYPRLGEMVGSRALTDFAEFIAGLKPYADVVRHLATAIGDLGDAFAAFKGGQFGAAGEAASKAKSELDQFSEGWKNAGNEAAKAQIKIERAYQITRIETKKAGLALDRGGSGGGDIGDGGAGGKAAKSKKPAADKGLDLAKANVALNESLDKLTDSFAKADKAQADYAAGLERAADPMIAYNEGMAKLAETQKSVGMSSEAVRVETARLTEERDKATAALNQNAEAEKAAVKAKEDAAKALQQFQEKWGFLGDAVKQATFDVLTGAEKIGQAVKRMISQIIAELIKLAAIKFAQKLLGGGSKIGALLGSAKGNVFDDGGVVTRPTKFAYGGGIGIMGEAGPEAVMPLRRNASGQLGVIGAGAGVNVTVNNNAPSTAIGVRQTSDGVQIDVIERQLADRIRRGGSPLPGAIENTYRSGRSASAFA